MALFLAGLRSVDGEIIKAAQVDGIPTIRIYSSIIIPSMTPIFLSAFIVLAHLAIKSFDLVISLTGGGPGYATVYLPLTCMPWPFQKHWSGSKFGNGNDDSYFCNHSPLPIFKLRKKWTMIKI